MLHFQQRGNLIRQVEDVAFNSPKEYKAFRTKEGEPSNAAKSRQQLRKGVADSLAGVAQPDALGDLLKPLGQAVVTEGRRRARALNPLTGADGDRLRLLAQGDYLINGFRNRDLRQSILGLWRRCGSASSAVGSDQVMVDCASSALTDPQECKKRIATN